MGCACWACRQGTLAEIAPRLARARTQFVEERRVRRRELTRARTDLLRAERLLAHRELQFIRAGARRSRRYLDLRAAKLQDAERLVERLRAKVARAA